MVGASSLALLIGLSLFGARSAGNSAPSSSDIAYVETRLRLPDDAPGPLSSYERYYAWTVGDDGKRLIYGELIYLDLLGPARPPGRYGRVHAVIEHEMPTIVDGGCGVITFYYNPSSSKAPSLYCNAVTQADSP